MTQSGFLTDLYAANVSASAPGALDLLASAGDLATVSDMDNLVQALRLRLLTPMGDLANLGHPDYGSRLFLLIGRLPGPDTAALAAAYLRESIRLEPRIDSIGRLEVKPVPGYPDTLGIEAELLPVQTASPITLSVSLGLGTGRIEVMAHGV